MKPEQKQYPVVDVTGDRSKVRCYKEQYCIGTWNVRSMNQGKLEVVKQEMATVNVNILGISELKWTGMGEFNSDDHSSSGQESLRRNGGAIIVNKRVRNAVQFSSVAQSCPTLCDPRNRSTPGLPGHHQLLEFTQTHVHRVHPTISSSVFPFSSCLQSFPASGSFPVSHFFASGGQSVNTLLYLLFNHQKPKTLSH